MAILLVDSDKDALDREVERLTDCRLAATSFLCSSADDAIRFAVRNDVEAVFIRDNLPDMAGRELAERIRRFKPQTECCILASGESVAFERFTKANRASGDTGAHGAGHDGVHGEGFADAGAIGCKTEEPTRPAVCCLGKRKGGDAHMPDKGLRGLGRKELLELMIEQGKELEANKERYEKDLKFLAAEHEKEIAALRDEYEKREQSLKAELAEARAAVQKREIVLSEAGSIAAAALQLSGVFEAAEAAGRQYVESVRSLSERQEALCAKRDAENRAENERRTKETEAECAAMKAEAKRKSKEYWKEVSGRLQAFYDEHQELKRLLDFDERDVSV